MTDEPDYLLPPDTEGEHRSWYMPYGVDARSDGSLAIRNHHEDWVVRPEAVPQLLRACLEAYEDPETGMSGVEMVEKAADAISDPSGYYSDDVFREPSPAALRRLLHDPEGGC